MSKTNLPNRDADLDQFATHLAEYVTANPTLVGLPPAIATQMTDLAKDFNVALAASVDPETRGGSKIQAKRIARKNLVKFLRPTIRVIQACLTTTDQMRYDMGLPIRKTHGTPAPVPGKTAMTVVSVNGNDVVVRVTNPLQPLSRAKPKDVQGISFFSYQGEEPSLDISKWKFEGSSGRTSTTIGFPAELPIGTKVWLTCFYFNSRKESGMACDPVGVTLYGGQMSKPAIAEMKLAA